MTIPTYEIIKYDDNDWEEYLNRISLYHIFKDVVVKYGKSSDICGGIIKYIISTYSVNSSRVVIGSDWVENKKNIAKSVGLDLLQLDPVENEEVEEIEGENIHKVSLYETVVQRGSKLVSKTIDKWLEWQNEENFSIWCMLGDLIVENRLAANSDIRKNTGERDYPQKEKCAISVIELSKRRKEVEQELIQNHPSLREAYAEMKKYESKDKGKTTGMGMEHYLKKKNNGNGDN